MIFAAAKQYLQAYMAGWSGEKKTKLLTDHGDHAIIAIHGVTGRGWFSDISSDLIIESLFAASKLKAKTVILDIDSPGGETTGIDDILAGIDLLKESKTVIAYTGGMMCSMGYYIACAAHKIVASQNATVGSIGTYVSVFKKSDDDWFVEVVSEQSPHKIPDPDNPDDMVSLQDYVNGCTELFFQAIAKYRNQEKEFVAENYGKGKIFLANQAKLNSMVDYIGVMRNAIDIGLGKQVEEPADPNEKPKSKGDGPQAKNKMAKVFAKAHGKKIKLKALAQEEITGEEGVAVEDLDADTLEQLNPDLFEEIKEMGRQEERDRLNEVEEVAELVDEEDEEGKEMVAKARADKSISASALTKQILAHNKAKHGSARGKVVQHPANANAREKFKNDSAFSPNANSSTADVRAKAEAEALEAIGKKFGR